jgi:hypothetical protein
MDRLNKTLVSIQFSYRTAVIGLVILTAAAILAYKAFDRGWFAPRSSESSYELKGQPELIFFNSYVGCECYRHVYRSAEVQVSYWSEEDRMGVPIKTVDFDKRADLRKQFNVMRAPTLMLVDAAGSIVYQQNEVVSDDYPLDLETFEVKIQEILNGD